MDPIGSLMLVLIVSLAVWVIFVSGPDFDLSLSYRGLYKRPWRELLTFTPPVTKIDAALETKFDIPSAVSIANSLVNQVLSQKPADFHGHLETIGVQTQLKAWTAIATEEVDRVRQHVLSKAN